MAKKIYLSPSSQSDNRYAVGGTTEAAQCRRISTACAKYLSGKFDVKNAIYGSMYTRVTESNRWGADLHVCIHTNAANGKVMGTRAFCASLNGEGYKVTKIIYDKLAPLTPGTSENIKVDMTLYEIKATNCPCAYIEVEFHDNPVSAAWIINNVDIIGKTIADGICEYYGVSSTPKPIKKDDPEQTKSEYTLRDFVLDVQKIVGAKEDGVAGKETLSKTITVSRKKNSTHKIVLPIQKRLITLGYPEVGVADGIAGLKFETAVKKFQNGNGCVSDGEITAKQKTWKKLLGME